MQRSDFHFELPDELIARAPASTRTGSRLLVMDRRSGDLADRHFPDVLTYLRKDDLLVFNNTRVIPARLFGHKSTGGKVEMLLERLTGPTRCLAHLRASKAPVAGATLTLGGGTFRVLGRHDDLFELQFEDGQGDLLPFLEAHGHIPLPPYMQRPDCAEDRERYQTVYANEPGAVAAPTAGLHFDEALMTRLIEVGVQQAFVTLHVGAGTFQPVKVDDLSTHRMHREWLRVDASVVEAVRRARAAGGRVIAVGTTSVRSLETAAASGSLAPFEGDTELFIRPGDAFRVVDGLITNFHLPESTLLMLVSALGGHASVMAAYRHAVAERYRFFSYGDAMLIL